MFEAPTEARTAAGYLLVLAVGIVFYMRLAFSRAANDVAVRSSLVRIIVCAGWGATIAIYVLWPELAVDWNFFMYLQVRWLIMVPAALGILLMVWVLRSQLRVDEGGNIVATGPYAVCRYPFDAALALFVVSVTLLCSNWLLVAVALAFNVVHRLGVPFELERARRAILGPVYDAYAARTGWFLPSAMPVKKAQYQVPSRFSLTAIMGLLTILAIIFGLLRAFDAPPVVYLFIGSEIVAICLVQILFGSAPRGGSALTGAILLPLWAYLTLRLPPIPQTYEFILFSTLFAFGGLLGYCIGTLAAGFFLMMDVIEPWLIRDSTAYKLPSPEFPVQDRPNE